MDNKRGEYFSDVPREIDYDTAIYLDYNSIINICSIGLSNICKDKEFWWDKVSYEVEKNQDYIEKMDEISKDVFEFEDGTNISRKEVLDILYSPPIFEINGKMYNGQEINEILSDLMGAPVRRNKVIYQDRTIKFLQVITSLNKEGYNFLHTKLRSLSYMLEKMDKQSKDFIIVADKVITRRDVLAKNTIEKFMIYSLNNNYCYYIRAIDAHEEIDYIDIMPKLDYSTFTNNEIFKFLLSKTTDRESQLTLFNLVILSGDYKKVERMLEIIGEINSAELDVIKLSLTSPEIVELIASQSAKLDKSRIPEYILVQGLTEIINEVNISSLCVLMKYYYKSVIVLINEMINIIEDNPTDDKYEKMLIDFLECFFSLENWIGKINISKSTLDYIKKLGISKLLEAKLTNLLVSTKRNRL